jgi:hypothetical protein
MDFFNAEVHTETNKRKNISPYAHKHDASISSFVSMGANEKKKDCEVFLL